MEKIKYLIISFGGIAAAYFKAYLPILAVVSVAVLFDIITGVVAAVYTGVGLNSKKARQGALKKAAMFLALGFGIFLDYLIPLAAARLSITIPQTVVFSSVIAFYIAFGECISVCENLYRCNPNAFPKWIAAILTESKNALDKKNGGE